MTTAGRCLAVTLALSCAAPGALAAAPVLVAVAPLSSFTAERPAPTEELLSSAIDSLGDHHAVRPDEIRALLRRAGRRDLEACDGEPGCLAEIGVLAGAPVVVYGEFGVLAGDHVLYLKAIDTASRRERGSTTTVLRKKDAAAAARAGVTRLLAPAAYSGVLELDVDLPGAVVYVDGAPAGRTPLAPIAVPVGTHTLRVTHARMRDFVRFIDIGFEQRTKVSARLTAYPALGDTLVAGGGGGFRGSVWLVAGVGAAALVTAAVIAFLVPRGFDRDRDVAVGGR